MANSCFYFKAEDPIVQSLSASLGVTEIDSNFISYIESLFHSISENYNLKIFNDIGEFYPEAKAHIERELCLSPRYVSTKEEEVDYNNRRVQALKEHKEKEITPEQFTALQKDFGSSNVLLIGNTLVIRPVEYKTKQEQTIAFMDLIQSISKNSLGKIWEKKIYSRLQEDKSVTSPSERLRFLHPLTEEEEDYFKKWKVSTWIGSEIDDFCKNFFNDVKGRYPNLTEEVKDNIRSILEDLKNNKAYEGAKFYTRDITLYGSFQYTQGVTSYIVGEPDLIIVDKDGNIHIVDFKTTRKRDDEKLQKYSEQLYFLENMLKQQSSKLGFNDINIDTGVLHIDVTYVTPENESGPNSYSLSSDGTIMFTDNNGNIHKLSELKEDDGEKEIPSFRVTEVNDNFTPTELKEISGIKGWVQPKAVVEQTRDPKVKVNSIYHLLLGDIVPRSRINSETTFIAKTVSSIIDDIIYLVNNKDSNEELVQETFDEITAVLNVEEDAFTEILEKLNTRQKSLNVNLRTAVLEELGSGNTKNGIVYLLNSIRDTYYSFTTNDIEEGLFNNFDALALLANSKIKYYEQLSSTGLDNNLAEVLNYMDETTRAEFENAEENSRESWQIAVEHLSAKSSLSKDIRRILGKLRKKNADGSYMYDDESNRPVYIDENEVFNTLLKWLQGCKNGEEMTAFIENHSTDIEADGTKSSTWIQPLLEEIKKEPMKSLFYQNFKKESKKYSTVVWTTSKGKRVLAVKMINTSNMFSNIYDEFSYNIAANKNVVFNKGIESVEALIKEVASVKGKLPSTEDKTFIADEEKLRSIAGSTAGILRNIGIVGYINNGEGIYNLLKEGSKGVEEVRSTLSNIANMLSTTLKQLKEGDVINTVKDLDSDSYIRNFISSIASLTRSEVEASCYENGKLYYSFVPPSYMGELISDLKNEFGIRSEEAYKEFLIDEYDSTFFGIAKDEDGKKLFPTSSFWLNKLYNDPTSRNVLDFKTQIHFNKTNYKDQDPATYTLSLMMEYYNGGNTKEAWYRVPIVSNKPAAEFIKFSKLKKEEIVKALPVLAIRELKRIKTVLYRWANDEVKIQNFDIVDDNKFAEIKSKLKNNQSITKEDLLTIADICKKSGASFKFLPFLNNILFSEESSSTQDSIVKFLNESTTETLNLSDLISNFKNLILFELENEVNKEIEQLGKLGLLEIKESTKKEGDKKTTSYSYKRLASIDKIGTRSSKEELEKNLKEFVSEFVYNEVFATANIILLSVSDLALYKNIEDFQKRYAQVHSNSLRLNTTATFTNEKGEDIRYSDGKHRCVYVKDKIISLDSTIAAVEKIYSNWINDAENKGDTGRKAYLEVARDNMVKALKGVNTTDGQAFTSITGFRKKRGMAGRWNENDENAYQKLLKGKYVDTANLNVSWAVTKPFQYSQIFKKAKVSGNGVLDNIKVGVQYKNSEYVLVMADALLRGQGETTELTEIFDFLESTHKNTDGSYRQDGIDTIQFESCVKTGGMGVIDIFNSKEGSIKEILEKYTNKDSDGKYLEEYVHETPFSDWGIQQEVPDHLKDHYQAIGSQVRILGISDISNTELQKEYQDLNAENIRLSYEELIDELKLKGSEVEKKEALSKLLVNEVMRNLERYGTDLLVAVSLNSKGDFNIPLNDFLNSTRIQQLLNSIIKSRIYKQKIAGGPTVQVSCLGYSNRCNIRYRNANGDLLVSKIDYLNEGHTEAEYKQYLKDNAAKIAYMEAFVSIPSEQMQKDMTKPDGSLMSVEEAINAGIIKEEQLKAIGYRIPTEDKYSMQPIKIVGFLPSTTESIILPDDLPALTGSDFDIDKIYLMMKEYKNRSNPIKVTSILEAFKAELGSNYNERLAKERISNFISNLDIDGYYRTMEKFKVGDAGERLLYKIISSNPSKYFSRYTEYPVDKASNESEKEIRKAVRANNNNRIIDIQFEVLTETEATLQLLSPGNFDTLKRQSKIIRALSLTEETYENLTKMSNKELDTLLEKQVLNPLVPSTQRYFQSQNMTAAKLIGIFANHNVSHAFVSMQDITLNSSFKHSFDIEDTHVGGGSKLDGIRNPDGNYISKVIAEFLNASVDAVKDPVLNYMNINTTTSGVAMLLARLGCNIETISLFLSNPIIRDVVTEFEIIKGNKEYIPLKDIISNKLKSLGGELKDTLTDVKITKNDLIEALRGNTNTSIDILNVFSVLHEMTADLTELVHCTKYNSINNAVGPNISNTVINETRVNTFKNRNTIFSENVKDVIDNSPILKAFYESSYGENGLSRKLLEDYFPHWDYEVTEILSAIERGIKGHLTAEDVDLIMSDLMVYKYHKEALSNNPEMYKQYIKEFPKVIDQYKQKKEFITNKLLQHLKFDKLNDGSYYLTTNLNNLENNTKENIQSDWEDLWNETIEGTGTPFDGTANLGRSLFIYFTLRSGFTYSPTIPTHLASTKMKIAAKNDTYYDALVSGFGSIIPSEFIDLFIRNNTNIRKFAPKFIPTKPVHIEDGIIRVDLTKNSEDYYKLITGKQEEKEDTFVRYIMYNDSLYSLVDTPSNNAGIESISLSYKPVSPLGISYKFKEYIVSRNSVFNTEESKVATEDNEVGMSDEDFLGKTSDNLSTVSKGNILTSSQQQSVNELLENDNIC